MNWCAPVIQLFQQAYYRVRLFKMRRATLCPSHHQYPELFWELQYLEDQLK